MLAVGWLTWLAWLAWLESPLGADGPDSAVFRNTKSLVRDTKLRVRLITPGIAFSDEPNDAACWTIKFGCGSTAEGLLLSVAND